MLALSISDVSISTVCETDGPSSRPGSSRAAFDAGGSSTTTSGRSGPVHHVVGDVIRSLHFYVPPRYGSPPRFIVADQNGSGIKNYGRTPVSVTIRDMRHKEHRFHLPLHSFRPLRNLPLLLHPLDLEDSSAITKIHAATADVVVDNLPSPGQITIFDTVLIKASNLLGAPRPTTSVEILETPAAALLQAKKHLTPLQAAEIEEGHLSLRIVTLYRPLRKISDHPLAVAESLTVEDKDLIPVEHVHPDHIGQIYSLKHSKGQKYWYWSGMDSTEGLLVQVYDSLTAVGADGRERGIRGATAFFRLMPSGWDEGLDAEWLVVRALVVG